MKELMSSFLDFFAWVARYPTWAQLLMGACVLIIFVVAITAKPNDDGAKPPSDGRQAQVSIGNQSAGQINNYFGGVNTPSPAPAPVTSSARPQVSPTDNSVAPHDATQDGIIWKFDPDLIFGFNETNDRKQALVGVFVVNGVNRSGEPITRFEANVVPGATGNKLPLYLAIDQGVPPPGGLPDTPNWFETKGFVIRPGDEFKLVRRIPPFDREYTQGVPIQEFLDRYGAITFVFTYNGDKSFTREFSYPQVEATLRRRQTRQDDDFARSRGPSQPIRVQNE